MLRLTERQQMAHALNGSLAFAVASPTPGRAGAGSTAVSSKGPLVPAAVAPLHKAQPTQPAHTPCLLTAANAWAGACEEAVDHAIATAIASVVTEISAAYYSLPSSERAAYKVAHSDTEAAVSQRLAPASSVSPLRGLMAMMEPSQEIDTFVSPFPYPGNRDGFSQKPKEAPFLFAAYTAAVTLELLELWFHGTTIPNLAAVSTNGRNTSTISAAALKNAHAASGKKDNERIKGGPGPKVKRLKKELPASQQTAAAEGGAAASIPISPACGAAASIPISPARGALSQYTTPELSPVCLVGGCLNMKFYPSKFCCDHGPKLCSVDGCSANPRGPKGLCNSHVRIPCSIDGCTTKAVSNGVCFKHGAFGKCLVGSCSSNANGKSGFCWRHGGKDGFCTTLGCDAPCRTGKNVCSKHGAYGTCAEHGCTANAKSVAKGMCYRHTAKVLCSAKGCRNLMKAQGVCGRHSGFDKVFLFLFLSSPLTSLFPFSSFDDFLSTPTHTHARNPRPLELFSLLKTQRRRGYWFRARRALLCRRLQQPSKSTRGLQEA